MTPPIWATVQQPILFPPIYMMERFARCHHVIFMDSAQFDRDNVQFLLMAKTGATMQSVQLASATFKTPFNERKIMRPDVWARKLATAAQSMYGRQEHYKELKSWFDGLLSIMGAMTDLPLFCAMSVVGICELLDMPIEFHLASKLVPYAIDEPTRWLVQLCKNASPAITDYEQGEMSMRSYFKKGPFERAGIRTWAQDFDIEYESNNKRLGHAGMSILDLLFVVGPKEARRLLQIDKGKGLQGTAFEVTR